MERTVNSVTYGVPAESNVKKRIKNYQAFGDEGMMCSWEQRKYSFEKKLSVVELYLSSKISYRELALQEVILNPTQIDKSNRV